MRFGLVADFRNPVQWRRPFPEFYAGILDQIRRAEALGFDNCWLTEHHFTDDGYNPSLLTAAAAIAAQTTRIRIGSYVLLLPFIHPVRAAEDVALVDIISGGRFDFGVGQGYSYHEFNGFCIDRATRGRRYRENIDIIRRLFTEDRVTVDGEFTRLRDVRLSPKPVQQPHPPIWVGARGPKAIARAAREGHNLIATFGKDPAPLYLETLAAAGRDPAAFRIGQLRMIYLSESEDQAWDECQDHLFHTLDFYNDIVTDALDAEGDEGFMPVGRPQDIRDSVLKDVVMVGTPQTVAAQMAEFVDNCTCTDFIAYMQFPGLDIQRANRSIELFAQHIMPVWRDA